MKNHAQGYLSRWLGVGRRSKAVRRLSLETLEDRAVPASGYSQIQLFDPYSANPSSGTVWALANGNFAVTAPTDNVNGLNGAGGVYLYSGSTGALISAMTGSHPGDGIGSAGITALSDGNFLVASPNWNGGLGAITWVNGVTGLSGAVSITNSLIGSSSKDAIGTQKPVLLPNGNYLIVSVAWNNRDGAVTWGSAATGVTGTISSANSFIGDPANHDGTASDSVGSLGVTVLANSNYVISSPNWNHQTGAVTWGNGVTGSSGVVSAANSLTGAKSTDSVGGLNASGVVPLSNGNYLVFSPLWNGQAGAVTWLDGTMPTSLVVSSTNSLVGATAGDLVGSDTFGRINSTLLSNGNCVISSPSWNNNAGAVTLLNAATGTTGLVSAANSLVGASSNDGIGSGGAIALSNGDFVVSSPSWNNNAGAATWVDGEQGAVGLVSSGNSLVGSPGDKVASSITALPNGNYVVASSSWSQNSGAVTWCNGAGGAVGAVSAANSLTGNPGDFVGVDGVTALTNGNYVVGSHSWNQSSGAVTWGNGAGGTIGPVSAANSLVGDQGDVIGSSGNPSHGSVVPLPNGNYVVSSTNWHLYTGAVTWGNGSGGTVGLVSPANSIVGIQGDYSIFTVNFLNVVVLANGNFVVVNPFWNHGAGAVTWGNGAIGTSGAVSSANSYVGDKSNGSGQFGLLNGISVFALPNGNYVIDNFAWNNGAGAVTWADGAHGFTGVASADNSLVGSQPSDLVGAVPAVGGYFQGTTPLSNGDFVVASALWNKGSGALTICSGTQATTGPIASSNSFVGVVPANFNTIEPSDLGNGNFSAINVDVYDTHGFGSLPTNFPVLYQAPSTPPQFVSPSQATFTLGIANSFTVKLEGPHASFSGVPGALPPGISFDPATGILSGKPTALTTGAYYLTFTAKDGAGNNSTQDFTLVIQQPITPATEAYVTAVYYDLLGRPPESSGLAYWVGQLTTSASRAAFVNFVNHSPEYYGTIIEPAYLKFLGRPADQAGLAYWTQQLSLGLRDELLEAAFIGSPEFYQHAGGTDKAWVDAMYQDLLGRNADAAGEAAWLQALALGANRALVAYGFAASVERDIQRVTAIYLKFLGRAPGAVEINYWVGQLGAGASSENIITGFASSDEFFQKHS
jgi:hypothetical protein